MKKFEDQQPLRRTCWLPYSNACDTLEMRRGGSTSERLASLSHAKIFLPSPDLTLPVVNFQSCSPISCSSDSSVRLLKPSDFEMQLECSLVNATGPAASTTGPAATATGPLLPIGNQN